MTKPVVVEKLEDQISRIKLLLAQGRYLDARAFTQEALKTNTNIEFQRLHAMALSKSGMPGQAKEFLERTYAEHPDEPETAGILGGIYKELFKRTEESNYAIQSRDTYLKNFSRTGNYYTGINAATMSAIAGHARTGREIAKEVIERIGTPDEFWKVATLGEAFLLSKDYAKSTDYYLKARQQAGTDWGKVSTVYNQLWLIKHYMHVPIDVLKIFHPPTVAAFVGHMIDHPNRSSPRFPASIEGVVKAAIKSTIISQKVSIGYCSLACGGDILFAEAMAEEGGEVNISLPFAKDDFVKASVAFAGEEWVNRFEALMSGHQITYVTHEPFDNHSDLFSMQSKVVLGSAILRSIMMRSEPQLLTVLSDFDLSRMLGGTRDNITLWPYPDRMINISPNNFITIDSSKVSDQKAIERQMPTSIRPALYTLVIDEGDEKEPEELFDLIDSNMDEIVVPPIASSIVDSKLVMGFSGLRPLIDFVNILKKIKGVKKNMLRLSIGGGPILLDDFHEKDTIKYKHMEGIHLKRVLAAHRYGSAGMCIAMSPIAYELALYKVELELLSRANIDNDDAVDVYKVIEQV